MVVAVGKNIEQTMETQERIRELLIGYLLNALSDGEAAQVERELERNPQLRAELETLQQEVAPLNHIGDSVEPPLMLANRTCANIWTTIDHEESGIIPNSGIFLDSACYSPEAMLPAFLLSAAAEQKESEMEKPKAAKNIEIAAEPPHSTPWIGLVASVSVGIIAAFVLFPLINYVKRSTQSRVAEMWMNEINQRVDQYEQIHGGSTAKVEEVQPYNLALSGWQEVHAEMLSSNEASVMQAAHEILRSPYPSQILPFFEELDKPLLLDVEGLAEHMLLVIPGQMIPLRSAFGQDFLFQDGRIFSRELPSAATPSQGTARR